MEYRKLTYYRFVLFMVVKVIRVSCFLVIIFFKIVIIGVS